VGHVLYGGDSLARSPSAFDTALQKRFLLQKSTQGFLLGMLVSFSQPASIELNSRWTNSHVGIAMLSGPDSGNSFVTSRNMSE
jgi:hypothetical protein